MSESQKILSRKKAAEIDQNIREAYVPGQFSTQELLNNTLSGAAGGGAAGAMGLGVGAVPGAAIGAGLGAGKTLLDTVAWRLKSSQAKVKALAEEIERRMNRVADNLADVYPEFQNYFRQYGKEFKDFVISKLSGSMTTPENIFTAMTQKAILDSAGQQRIVAQNPQAVSAGRKLTKVAYMYNFDTGITTEPIWGGATRPMMQPVYETAQQLAAPAAAGAAKVMPGALALGVGGAVGLGTNKALESVEYAVGGGRDGIIKQDLAEIPAMISLIIGETQNNPEITVAGQEFSKYLAALSQDWSQKLEQAKETP